MSQPSDYSSGKFFQPPYTTEPCAAVRTPLDILDPRTFQERSGSFEYQEVGKHEFVFVTPKFSTTEDIHRAQPSASHAQSPQENQFTQRANHQATETRAKSSASSTHSKKSDLALKHALETKQLEEETRHKAHMLKIKQEYEMMYCQSTSNGSGSVCEPWERASRTESWVSEQYVTTNKRSGIAPTPTPHPTTQPDTVTRASHPPHSAIHNLSQHNTKEPTTSINDWMNGLHVGDVVDNTVHPAAVINMDWTKLAITPKYDGSPLHWVDWSLKFRNRIHDNPYLTKGQKLSLLQDSLGEEPKARIFGLLWDPRFYEMALGKLRDLYGNESQIVSSYVDEVRNWSPRDKKFDLVEYSVLVSKITQVFQSLGFDADLKAQALLYDMIAKLPDSMKRSWGKYVQKNGTPDVQKFQLWLSSEEEALRLGGVTSSGGISKPKAINVLGTTYEALSTTKTKCMYCQSTEHYIQNCGDFVRKDHSARMEWFKKERRCNRCAREGHRAAECRLNIRCRIDGCGGRHNSVLHQAFVNPHSANRVDTGEEVRIEKEDPVTVNMSQCALSSKNKIFVQTLPVLCHSPDGLTVHSYALLDPGSQGCLISKRLADKLNLKGSRCTLRMSNVAQDIEPVKSRAVHLRVSNPFDRSSLPIVISEAWTLDKLRLPSQKLPRNSEGKPEWVHVQDLQIPDIDGSEIDLLIGASCKAAFRRLDERIAPHNQPDAVKTPLGWCLLGGEDPTPNGYSADIIEIAENILISHPSQEEPTLIDLVSRFWDVEDLGCKFIDGKELSMEDRQALDRMERETQHMPCGRYQVPMLFKEESPILENNELQARSRYRSLRRQLLRRGDEQQTYRAAMDDYIRAGYLRKLSHEEVGMTTVMTRYLTHFSVIHPQKRKLRVVMDAALKYRGTSLNDHLVMGPFMTNALVGVILRFRVGSVGLSADIKSMFNRVLVPERMQHALRVMWSETLDEKPEVYQFQVHVFGAKCSPSCATYALRRCALDSRGQYPDNAISEILKRTYVDDYLSSANSEEEASEITKNVIAICARGGFEMTKWVSTSPKVLDTVASNPGITAEVDLDFDNCPTSRVLGIHWLVKEDRLTFRKTERTFRNITKRNLLSLLCSLYDPLGILTPFVMRGRVLVQMLWMGKVGWDDDIEPNMKASISEWASEIDDIPNLSVPRTYWPTDMKPVHISLHFFGDASEKAYAACCYARVQNSEGDVHVSFVMSRMRVTPVGRRQLSLPRLELQAAVLSTRLYGLIQKELDLNVQEVFFWSDSNTVLQYLANTTRRFKVFVGNRVAEILSTTAIYQWRHCPGSLNPSDLATRGMRIPDLKTRNAWLHGPDFLWKPNDQWPKMLIPESIPDADTECRATQSHHTTITAQEDFMDPCRYSSLSRLLNVTGWCLRYVQNGKTMIAKSDSKSRNLNKYLSVDELSQAKAFWIKSAQLDVFAGEISALKNNINTSKETHSGEPKAVVRPSSTLVKLRPFLEDTSTFLRVGGRIGEANIPYGCKHQIILPKSHRITELIVHDCHVRLQHGSSETIITKLRETFWIPAIRPLVKKVINACPLCKRELAKPAIPVMADLPTARLQESIWSHTGVDTFGPLQIKQGRRNLKVWVLLFCSMTIRAIHLELIRTTDTDSFIMAWRRFISRRGKVLKLYSDPGSNFTGADPELRKAFKELHSDEKFGKYLTSEGIQFAFNPPKRLIWEGPGNPL